jgi:hypothetical protein
VNYRYFDNPFPDEEGEEIQIGTLDIYQVTLGSPDPSTVREARTFDDWPEWEKAIRSKLDQLAGFGTWQLVDCPKDAIPIPNKWVFVKKYNKQGELVKYKARLVVKGCAQRPGFDYTDTYTPVMRMEMLCAGVIYGADMQIYHAPNGRQRHLLKRCTKRGCVTVSWLIIG